MSLKYKRMALMQDFLLGYYSWIKALHVISVVAFMAGMLYLPRLFVYHVGAGAGGELSETLKIMERRLLRYIINPAMIAMIIFGSLMFWANPELIKMPWMHAKILLLVGMFAAHHVFARARKNFELDRNTKSAKFFRIWNEIPTILMIGIILLAVVKPF